MNRGVGKNDQFHIMRLRSHTDANLTAFQVSGFSRAAKKSSRELARTVRGQTRSRYARDKSAKLRADARNIFRKVEIEKKTLARENTRTNAR